MRNSNKRGHKVDYKSFLKRNAITNRRCAYISEDIHERISKIVSIIGNGEVSIGGYVDIVLSTHLEQYKAEINELYAQKCKVLL